MEKLKKYNQKILAILGTLVLISLVVILISAVVAIIYDATRSYQVSDESITLDEQEDSPIKLRDQEISFENPQLMDTLNQIYLVPVGLVNLKTPEEVLTESEAMRSVDYYSLGHEVKSYRSGNYTNFIIYDLKQNTKKTLFADVTYLQSYSKIILGDSIYILFKGTTKDSNGDKKLNQKDLQSLFVYSFSSRNLAQYNYENMSYSGYKRLLNSDKLALSFSVDKDKNGEIDWSHEPSRLKIVDVNSGKLEDFADDKLLKELQSKLD